MVILIAKTSSRGAHICHNEATDLVMNLQATPYYAGITLTNTTVHIYDGRLSAFEFAPLPSCTHKHTRTGAGSCRINITGVDWSDESWLHTADSDMVTCSSGTGQIRDSDERWETVTRRVVNISLWTLSHVPKNVTPSKKSLKNY